MEREEEFRQGTINEINKLKIKVKCLGILVITLFGVAVCISIWLYTKSFGI